MPFLKKRLFLLLLIVFFSIGFYFLAFHFIRTPRSKASFGSDTNVYLPKLKQYQVDVATELKKNPTKTDVLIFLQPPEIQNKVRSKDESSRQKEKKDFVDELKLKTSVIQQKVLSSLQYLQNDKKLIVKKSFFIDNIIYAEADSDAIDALSNTPGIVKVMSNIQISLPPLVEISSVTPEWNIVKIGADRVWSELGITGQGVVVGNIDTGVQWDHPALKEKYRGFDGTNVNNDYNWYDPSGTYQNMPFDDYGHGTHVMGIMVGSDETNHIGVAPGAKWIAAKGCISGGCSAFDLITSGQWMLAPTKIDGTEPDATKAPDVINNSWSGGGCDNWYQGIVQSWRNAGIIPVFSIGNYGPNPLTVASPGDYPESIGVGATDVSDRVANFSSRGPSCPSFGEGIKPEVVAPGVNIRSSIPYDSFMSLNGTSMAAPHIAGLVALLLQAKSTLTLYEIGWLLENTAIDLGSTGKDNSYGSGLINAYNAVIASSNPIPTVTPTPTLRPTETPFPTKTPTQTPTPLPTLYIKLNSPNGGEKLYVGQTHKITWESDPQIQKTTIYLLPKDDTSKLIVNSIDNKNYYDWFINDQYIYRVNFKILIYGLTYTPKGTIYSRDESDYWFEISYPPTPIPSPTSSPTSTPVPTKTPTPTRTPTPTPKPSTIDIYAYGTQSSNIYPTMKLYLNDKLLKTWTNIKPSNPNSVFNKYTFVLTRKIVANDKIKIYYTNDDKNLGISGRNLRVDKVVVDGKIYQTESSTVYSTGTWLSASGICKPRYSQSEWLHCNGYFLYLLQ